MPLDSTNDLSPTRIRTLRRALRMTQQELAERIGVAKVTVARWETGGRRCRGDYARRVLLIGAEGNVRATTVFSVSLDDLSRLSPRTAVELFQDLLRAEAASAGVPATSVSGGQREVADGGVDALVPSAEAESLAGLIAAGSNCYQVKTGSSARPWQPAWVRRELCDGAGALGKAVARCLRGGGRYVLVCFGLDLTSDQRAQAEDHIGGLLTEHGHAGTRVDVLGQQELASCLSYYPSLSLRASGRGALEFLPITSWRRAHDMSLSLHADDARRALTLEIQEYLRGEEVRHVRIVGEPGVGKTRLVLEALSEPDLAPRVAYVPNAEDFERSQLFKDLLRPDATYSLILVLDECLPRNASSIWNSLRSYSERCKVVSIDHDSYAPADEMFREVECTPLADDTISGIISEYVGQSEDPGRWARFCSGSPRVAHAVGRSLQHSPSEVLESMEGVWQRFVAGYGDAESTRVRQKLIVLRHVALFYRFGFEKPVTTEAKAIAELVEATHPEITWSRFQDIIEELRKQRILQGKRTLFIAPKLLHICMWKQFWQRHGRDVSVADFVRDLSIELREWFARMFPYAAESSVAREQVEDVLAEGGPFGEIGFALSEFGARFLRLLSEACPGPALGCIERVLERSDGATLKAFSGGRQDFVWALEKIAVWPKHFARAARALLKLAEYENSSYATNATGIFSDLFCFVPGRLAPTAAPPERRLPVLEAALQSGSEAVRRLALGACKSAFTPRGGIRIVGREHQGLIPTLKMWTPATWGEVHVAIGSVWEMLVRESSGWEGALQDEAHTTLVEAAGSLLPVESLTDSILATVFQICDESPRSHGRVVKMIGHALRFQADHLDQKTVEALKHVDEKIAGASFPTRLRRVVHLSNWDEHYDDKGRDDESFSARVAELASEALEDGPGFGEVLPDLVRGRNVVVFQFGRLLAREDGEWTLLPAILAELERAASGATTLLVNGYLTTLFEADSEAWLRVVTGLIATPVLRHLVGNVVAQSGFTEEALREVLSAYAAGTLDVQALLGFRYKRQLRDMPEDTLSQLIDSLFEAGHASGALEYLDFVYCDKDEPRKLPHDHVLRLLRYGELETRRDQGMHDYHWSVVAARFIRQYPDAALAVFDSALDRIVAFGWRLDDVNRATAVVQSVIETNPDQCWRHVTGRLSDVDSEGRWRILNWLSPGPYFGASDHPGILASFPLDLVMEWIAEDPALRAREMARVVPKTLGQEPAGELTRALLERYGDDDRLRGTLRAHFGTGGWSGPASAHYREMLEGAREWLGATKSMRIRTWLGEYIDGLTAEVEAAETREERRTW